MLIASRWMGSYVQASAVQRRSLSSHDAQGSWHHKQPGYWVGSSGMYQASLHSTTVRQPVEGLQQELLHTIALI